MTDVVTTNGDWIRADRRVEEINPLADARWGAAIEGRPGALFSSPRWLQVLADTYDIDVRARVLLGEHRVDAGVLYCTLDDLRGRRIVSVPFCDLNDPLIRSSEEWEALTSGLLDGDTPALFRTSGSEALLSDDRLVSTEAGVWHELDARKSPEESFADFATMPKRMIRRAERDGMVLRTTLSNDDLRRFFELHRDVRKYRHGLLAQPFEMFEAISERFFAAGDGCIVGGYVDDELVGGCLVLVEGETAYYKFSASHPDHRRGGVSHATLFAGLRYAHERGCRAFDLGRSDASTPGLIDFKRRFRPLERPLFTHRRASDSPIEHGSASDAGQLLGSLTELLVRPDVPDEVSERAGQLLYRYFA